MTIPREVLEELCEARVAYEDNPRESTLERLHKADAAYRAAKAAAEPKPLRTRAEIDAQIANLVRYAQRNSSGHMPDEIRLVSQDIVRILGDLCREHWGEPDPAPAPDPADAYAAALAEVRQCECALQIARHNLKEAARDTVYVVGYSPAADAAASKAARLSSDSPSNGSGGER
jgi:hypothetical protein